MSEDINSLFLAKFDELQKQMQELKRDIKEDMNRNFAELYTKNDQQAQKYAKLNTALAVTQRDLTAHIEDEKSTMQRFGQRLQTVEDSALSVIELKRKVERIEKKPAEVWKWIAGIAGGIIVISNALEIIKRIVK